MFRRVGQVVVCALAVAAGCAGRDAFEADAVLAVKDTVSTELANLREASAAIGDRAPAPDADGWQGGAELDPAKAAWEDARRSYERIEGAIAVLFHDLDASTDERYEGFLAEGPDDDPFDGEGVIGVHAIERILWADAHPPEVVAFESGLTGYAPAVFPASEGEAARFVSELVQRLVDDVDGMDRAFEPLALDSAAAYEGVVGSIGEQVEKVALAATGEDESRYAQHTLGDMRANLDGGRAIYEAFAPWVRSIDGGEALDAGVTAGFDRVEAAYAALDGDALPEVPATWNPDDPSAADLATAYGELWGLLSVESDPDAPGALVERMVAAADAVGIGIVP